jgi:hypothetical protein
MPHILINIGADIHICLHIEILNLWNEILYMAEYLQAIKRIMCHSYPQGIKILKYESNWIINYAVDDDEHMHAINR